MTCQTIHKPADMQYCVTFFWLTSCIICVSKWTTSWTTRFRFIPEQEFVSVLLSCPGWLLAQRTCCLWALFLQVKQLRVGGDHSPPSNAKVKNVWCFTYTAHHLGTGKTLYFAVLLILWGKFDRATVQYGG